MQIHHHSPRQARDKRTKPLCLLTTDALFASLLRFVSLLYPVLIMQLVNALSITATTGSIVLMARAFDNPIDPGLAVSAEEQNTKRTQNEHKNEHKTKQNEHTALCGWSQHVFIIRALLN